MYVTSEIFCILARAYVPTTNVHAAHVLINVRSSVSVNAEKKEKKKEKKKELECDL